MIRTFYLLIVMSVVALAGCDAKDLDSNTKEPSLALESDEDKLSYGVGINIGGGLKQQGIPGMNLEAIILGIEDSLAGVESRVPQTEMEAVVARLQEREAAKMEALAEENATKGADFLKTNGEREGVVTTESGLQYEVLQTGNGDSPTADSVVKTHYHGTLIDGTVFDSSVDRGQPVEFAVDQVIPGWTEALQLMKVGDKWRLYVPAELGYGEYSPGPSIPPNSTLVFDVELVDIVNIDVETPGDAS